MWFVARLTKNIRVCTNGHRYLKSSDCPACPICEAQKEPASDLPKLAAPARRALENAGIFSLFQLSSFTESEISELHGLGPTTLPILKAALEAKGLNFNKLAK